MSSLPVPFEPIRVVACPNPFKQAHEEYRLAPAPSLLSILKEVQPDISRYQAHVWVNDAYIPPAAWAATYPAPGSEIAIRVIPQGDIGRVLLSVFVVIAAIAAAVLVPWLMGPAFPILGPMLGALAGMTISFVGNLAINALFPPTANPSRQSALSGGQDSPTYSLTGGSNTINKFGPVPMILGRHKVFPGYGAEPYTEIVGDDQYLRLYFVWGFAGMEIEDLKIGDTPLGQFEGVEIEHRNLTYLDPQGNRTVYGDDPLTLYTRDIHEAGPDQQFPILLEQDKPQVRTTQTGVTEISLDITFPQGLYGLDGQGNRGNKGWDGKIEYRRTGTEDWILQESIALLLCSASAVRKGYRWPVNPEGDPQSQYDVRVTRFEPPDGPMSVTTSYWTTLRSIKPSDPVNIPVLLAKTVFRIKASNSLSGTVQTFSGIASRIVKDWDSASQAWVSRTTQNPASLWREAAQGLHKQDPFTDQEIDLAKLQYWHEYCEAQGWKYNKVVDYKVSFWELIAEIAAAGRAARTWIDGKLSVIIDEPQDFQIGPTLTPRNTSNFKSEINYPDLPHAWRCAFKNELEEYKDDERIILDDGYQIEGLDAWGNAAPALPPATVFQELPLLGITHPDLIFRHARYHIAAARLREFESHELIAHAEVLVATRGDRVKFSHDVLLAGLAWGRVKALDLEIAGYEYHSVYPPAHNDTYVKATTQYGGSFRPYFATDPSKSLVGTWGGNSWLSQNGLATNQRFHLDLGTAKIIGKIYYENAHNSGVSSNRGVRNFTFWGSNDPAAFAQLDYGIDTGWEQIASVATEFSKHIAADQADPQYIEVINNTPYRYYAFKFANNWGGTAYMGLRRLELQERGAPVYSGNLAGVFLDDICPMEAGKDYCIRLSLEDNSSLLALVDTVPGPENTYLTFRDAITPANPWPQVGNIFQFGESGKEAIDLIIKAIRPNANLGGQLTLVPYNEAIYTADQGLIPAHKPNCSTPPEWWVPVIDSLRSDGSVLFRAGDGSWQSRILITFRRLLGIDPNISEVEAQYWRTDSGSGAAASAVVPLESGEISLLAVEDGVSYDLRLRYLKKDGGKGPWTATQSHTVEGKTSPPADVAGLQVYQTREMVTLSWTKNPDLDLRGYELRYGPVGCTWVSASLITEVMLATAFSTPLIPPGAWDFLVKAVDTSGNLSNLEARKSFTVMQFYTVLASPLSFPLWAGTKTNMIRDPLTGYLVPTDQALASGNNFDVFDNFVVNPYATYGYEAPEIDLGADISGRAWARIYANLGPGETGDPASDLQVDYRTQAGAYDGFASGAITVFMGRYIKFKLVHTSALGDIVLTEFQPVVDKVY